MVKGRLKSLLKLAIREAIRSDRILRSAVEQVIEDPRGIDVITGRLNSLVGPMDVGTTNQITREVWLEKALKAVPAGSRILDAGAGECQYRKFCGHLEYVSQDLAQYNGAGDMVGLQTGTWDVTKLDIVSDIADIPERDASFDAIMCIEVLEHVPDPLKAFREFSRLLRPGGEIIITAPFCSLTHFAPEHYSTGFSKFYFQEHLVAFGFSVEELTPNGNYFDYIAQEVRRIPYVAERYVKDEKEKRHELAIPLLLSVLDEYSKKGSISSELLTFGWFVRGKKV